MTILTADGFDRTDVNPIGSPYTTITSNSAMQIVSGKATPSSLATDCGAWKSGTYPNDQWVEANLTVTSSATTGGQGVALYARCATGANTCYRVALCHGATTNIQLGKFVANTFTTLWTRLQAFTDGALVRLECRGTTLRLFINGVQVGADVTDSAVTAGQPGIGYSSASTTVSQIDNFRAGDFGSQLYAPAPASIIRANYW